MNSYEERFWMERAAHETGGSFREQVHVAHATTRKPIRTKDAIKVSIDIAAS